MVARGQEVDRNEQSEHRDFQSGENTVYGTIMMDMCHYTFVKFHRVYIKSEPLAYMGKESEKEWVYVFV